MKLSEIEARCEAATSGPWDYVLVSGDLHPTVTLNSVGICHSESDDPISAGDSIFIANARTDVPALVALVRQLGEALEATGDPKIGDDGLFDAALAAYRSVLDEH